MEIVCFQISKNLSHIELLYFRKVISLSVTEETISFGLNLVTVWLKSSN